MCKQPCKGLGVLFVWGNTQGSHLTLWSGISPVVIVVPVIKLGSVTPLNHLSGLHAKVLLSLCETFPVPYLSIIFTCSASHTQFFSVLAVICRVTWTKFGFPSTQNSTTFQEWPFLVPTELCWVSKCREPVPLPQEIKSRDQRWPGCSCESILAKALLPVSSRPPTSPHPFLASSSRLWQ